MIFLFFVYKNSAFEIHTYAKSFIVFTKKSKLKKKWLKWLTKIENQLKSDFKTNPYLEFNSINFFSNRTAPIWYKDSFSDTCMNSSCDLKFNSLTRRRHHCRLCGY